MYYALYMKYKMQTSVKYKIKLILHQNICKMLFLLKIQIKQNRKVELNFL